MADARQNKNIRLVQITDAHLFADKGVIFDGLNTFETLKDVIQLIRKQQSEIDCLLCTGDLTQDSSMEAYRHFLEAVSVFDAPQLWIPGNHDTRSQMQQILPPGTEFLKRSIQLENWRVIMLDSSVEGEVYGRLAPKELDDLEMELADCERNSHYALVCLHHNCLPVSAAWLQQHSLKNSDEFFAILDRYSLVRGVLYGHIHQALDAQRGDMKIMASPSTCIQFHPTNDHFTIDNKNPGYRWIELGADGEITSGVERVDEKSYNIDFSNTGY